MIELAGKRILLVEDEYILASDLAEFLGQHGVEVAGPVGTVAQALAMTGNALDAAVLDVNLQGERVYPVADALLERGVPVVFATGYDELLVHRSYIGLPRCRKPIDKLALLKLLQSVLETKKFGTKPAG